MKKNLKIEDFEDKKSQAGKRYTRFKTNEGWMSAFDKKVIADLKEQEGNWVSVGVTVNEEKGFKNITQFHGVGEPNHEIDETPIRIGQTKRWSPASMYVSYAKDIFCVLSERMAADCTTKDVEEEMDFAISLVKRAKTAFEE